MSVRQRIAFLASLSRSGGKFASMAQVIVLRSLAMGVNIGTSLFTAAMLGPSGRGEQAALIVAPSFLAGLASLGLHASLIYNLKADPGQERELLGTGIMLTCLSGLVATAVGWIIEPYWLSQYSHETIMVGRVLLLVTPTIVIAWTLNGAAEANGWFGLGNRVLYLQSLATFAILGVLAALHLLNSATAACAYILPMLPVFVYLYRQIARRMKPVFRIRFDLAYRLLHFGLRMCGLDVLGTLSGTIDQLIIIAYLAPSTVGTYAVALSSARMLTVIQGGVNAVMFPSIAARSTASVIDSVGVTFRITTLVIASLASMLAIIGPTLLILAYGMRFEGSILPFRILLVAMVAENGARLLYQIYSGGGRPGVVTMFECSGVTISLLVMALLVPHFGTTGAAVAVLTASSFRLVAAICGLRLILKVKPPRLLLGWSDIKMIWATLSRKAAPGLEVRRPGLETVP